MALNLGRLGRYCRKSGTGAGAVCAVVAGGLFLGSVLGLKIAKAADAPLTLVERVYRASIHFSSKDISKDGSCTGTAIGLHALLTATHCESSEDYIVVNRTQLQYVKPPLRDHFDHSILYLKGGHFPVWLPVNVNDPLIPGEAVMFFGNPGDYEDLVRIGYVAGHHLPNILDVLSGRDVEPPMVLLSTPVWPGDSGSGVVNTKGEIIAVVSQIVYPKSENYPPPLTGCYLLRFTQQQLAEAAAF